MSSNFKERRENIKKRNNQPMNSEHNEVSALEKFFQQENEQKEKEKQDLHKYQGHLCDDYSIDDVEKKFQTRKEKVFELIKEMKNNTFFANATDDDIYEIAIMQLEKEQELRDLEQFKDFIISCLEEDNKNGYVVREYTIEKMDYGYWKKYWINNTTPSLRGHHFRGDEFTRRIIPNNSWKLSVTTPVFDYGIFCTPEYANADRTEERKYSREVPITSILSKVDFYCYSTNIAFLSKLISNYGKQENWYHCEDTATLGRTYILDELLKITITECHRDESDYIILKVELI